MRSHAHRKLTRFFVINPRTDRRLEPRFHAKENVVIKLGDEQSTRTFPAVASEIGKNGLKLECPTKIGVGTWIQIAFPNASDAVRCFGRIVWVRPAPFGSGFQWGVSIDEWHGITSGSDSWKRFSGPVPKHDRRIIKR